MARHRPVDVRVFDLGELWQRLTGLPFVFGLWIVRQAAWQAQREAIRHFERQLGQALGLAFEDLPGMAAQVAENGPLDAAELVDYWRAVSYTLTPQHLAGLRRFFSLCVKHGLLAEEPELRFVD